MSLISRCRDTSTRALCCLTASWLKRHRNFLSVTSVQQCAIEWQSPNWNMEEKVRHSFRFSLQTWAKKWSLGCENFLPSPAWFLLSKRGPLFSPSLYMSHELIVT